MTLDDDDLRAIKLESKRTIDLVQFVDHTEIDPRYFENPRYVVPAEDDVAHEEFAVIREALRKSQKVGLGQMATRGKDQICAVRPCGDGILLETLRYEKEVKDSGECFFQKHNNSSTPDSNETVRIQEKDGGSGEYIVIRNRAGLSGTTHIGGMELHVWGSREDSLEKPERMVFDLDPDKGLDFSHVVRGAVELCGILESVGLKSFPLLTCGKGMYVIVPIAGTRGWPEVKSSCRGLAQTVAKASPDREVVQASKAKREGRIFFDWLRNERGATAVAPFSPAATKMPLSHQPSPGRNFPASGQPPPSQ